MFKRHALLVKGQTMRYRIRFFLMLVVIATMLAGCAAGESSIQKRFEINKHRGEETP